MNLTRDAALWPGGEKAAVCLSYDDAKRCHIDLVAPALEVHGFRATFYVPIWSDLVANTQDWRELSARGHELGNHTISHPCRSDPAGPQSGENWNDLRYFTRNQFHRELETANFALSLIDGETERTYGNTCHEVWIGPDENKQRIEPVLSDLFVAARGELTGRPTFPAHADLSNLGNAAADGKTFAEWRKLVEEAVAIGGLLILTFHSVGEGYGPHQVAASDHLQLLQHLHQNRETIWTAPVIEVARHLRARQTEL